MARMFAVDESERRYRQVAASRDSPAARWKRRSRSRRSAAATSGFQRMWMTTGGPGQTSESTVPVTAAVTRTAAIKRPAICQPRRWRSAVVTGCRSLESGQRLLHVLVVRLVARIVQHFAMADDAIAIDDEHGALGNVLEADHVRIDDAVLPDDVLVVVAEQREIQLLLIRPRLLREERVGADAEHLRRGLAEFGHRVAERAHLLLAHAAERRREKDENGGTVLQLLAERDVLPVLIRQRGIGRLGANLYGHELLLLSLRLWCASILPNLPLGEQPPVCNGRA